MHRDILSTPACLALMVGPPALPRTCLCTTAHDLGRGPHLRDLSLPLQLDERQRARHKLVQRQRPRGPHSAADSGPRARRGALRAAPATASLSAAVRWRVAGRACGLAGLRGWGGRAERGRGVQTQVLAQQRAQCVIRERALGHLDRLHARRRLLKVWSTWLAGTVQDARGTGGPGRCGSRLGVGGPHGGGGAVAEPDAALRAVAGADVRDAGAAGDVVQGGPLARCQR